MSLPIPKPGIMKISPYTPGKSGKTAARTIKLSSNENSYGPSPKAIAAYEEAFKKLNRYPDANATELREAIGEVQGVDPSRIVCGAGSDELIGLLVNAYAGEGDEVLYCEHGFLMYKIYTLGAGATPVEAPEVDYTADVDRILASVTPNTKLVFLANPNNPTGTYLSEAEVKRLRTALPSHILLAIDAAYAECVTADDYEPGLKLALSTQNTVMLRTFSKTYGLPALRPGWMVASAEIIDVINRLKGPFNTSYAAQMAGIAAMRDKAYTEEQKRLNAEQREALTKALKDLGLTVYPSQGNFVLVDFNDAALASTVCKRLVDEHGIYVREVVNYKLPTCLRITVGTAEENGILLDALKKLL
ncbi:MAG: histidinol-phosphate transaminase [Rickettsiales bacterium]